METTHPEPQGSSDSFEDLFKILVRRSDDSVVDPSGVQTSAEYFHSGLWLFTDATTPPKP